jgi:pumilio RNA-binding family
MSMIRDQYSNYTVQKAIDLADDVQIQQIMEQLQGNIAVVRKCTYGKHIVARLEKRTGTRL